MNIIMGYAHFVHGSKCPLVFDYDHSVGCKGTVPENKGIARFKYEGGSATECDETYDAVKLVCTIFKNQDIFCETDLYTLFFSETNRKKLDDILNKQMDKNCHIDPLYIPEWTGLKPLSTIAHDMMRRVGKKETSVPESKVLHKIPRVIPKKKKKSLKLWRRKKK